MIVISIEKSMIALAMITTSNNTSHTSCSSDNNGEDNYERNGKNIDTNNAENEKNISIVEIKTLIMNMMLIIISLLIMITYMMTEH